MEFSQYYANIDLDRDTYRSESERLKTKFKADLLRTLGVADHPKADRLFEIAWGMGHAYGLNEVYYVAQELADLLRS